MLGTILARSDRCGVVEEYHLGAAAVVGPGGLKAAVGDIHTPFYMRSVAKPFQALAAVEAGADLPPTHLAVACGSHSGDPVHVALVVDILARSGLGVEALRCPPDRPRGASDRRLARAGDESPSPVYHNCSGKHAAMLAACATAGWDPGGYLRPDHPLQLRIGDVLAEILGGDPGSPGIDGCGAPVWRASVADIAGAYARLAGDERFAAIRQAMARYPMLVSGEARPDGSIGRWTGGVAKGGAAGCMGTAVAGHGIASKAWSGSGAVAAIGVALGVDWLGMLTPAVRSGLADVISPPVFGGGAVVGRIRPSAVLEPV